MSQKTFSVDEILWAFIENTGGADGAVAVSIAGEPWGYVRVKGPSGKHQVVIERYNATVAVEDVHRSLPGVKARPSKAGSRTTCAKRITEHPLGYSFRPQMGQRWGISAKDLAKHYASPAKFVKALVDECAKVGSPW